MPLAAITSSSNVLYASTMFLAVYSTFNPLILLVLGNSSATSAKWLVKNVTPILTGFWVFNGLVLCCLKLITAFLTACFNSFSIFVMLELLAESLLRECFRGTVFAHGAYRLTSSFRSWASPAMSIMGMLYSPAV